MTDTSTPNEADDIRFKIRDVVAAQVIDGPDGTATIDDRGIEAISKAIDALLDGPDLIDAVDAMLVIGHWIEVELKSPKCATRVVDIVNRESVIDSMKRIHKASQEQTKDRTQKGAEDFNKFAQRTPTIEKTVPDPDKEAPSNAVKLNNLAFPKRL